MAAVIVLDDGTTIVPYNSSRTGPQMDRAMDRGDSVGVLTDLTTTEKSSVVGAINEVKSDITNVNEDLNRHIELNKLGLEDMVISNFIVGGLDTQGQLYGAANRMRTFVYMDLQNFIIEIPDGYKAKIAYYHRKDINSTEKVFDEMTDWLTTTTNITISDNTESGIFKVIKVLAGRVDDADISEQDLKQVKIIYKKAFVGTKLTNLSENTAMLSLGGSGFSYPWDGFKTTQYIEIEGNKTYKTCGIRNGTFFSDKLQVLWSFRTSDIINNEVTSPANAKYIRFCYKDIDTTDNIITEVSKFDSDTRLPSYVTTGLGTVDMKGKTIAILGDSISTNGDVGTGDNANVPEIKIETADVGKSLSAYVTYYDVQKGLSINGHTFASSEIGTKVTFTPSSSDVGKTIGLSNNYNPNSTKVWWEHLCEATGATPIPVCWSGSSITSHEKNIDTRKCSYAWHESQINKCGIRIAGTMTRTAPDAIIIYRGTNDFSHEPYTRLTDGYFDNVNFNYPATDEVAGGYGYKEGLVLTIKKLRDAYPNAKIFLCTLNVFKRINYAHFPTNNGLNTLPQYNNVIREIADFMGCGLIEFDKDGITFENCYSQGYITDSATIPTHPSDKGHAVMGKKAISDFSSQWSNMS